MAFSSSALDLSNETPLALADVPDYVERLTRRRPSMSSIWRWRLRGIRGQKLRGVMVGGRVVTSEEEVRRFFAALEYVRAANTTRQVSSHVH